MQEELKTAPMQSTEATNLPTVSHETAPVVNDYDIDAFLAKRKEFIEKVNAIMVEGSDYHVIKNKKSLGKGGAEKIASIFGWRATFEKDSDVIQAFESVKGLVAFICNLAKGDEVVGQGRGAASLSGNANDPNKTIKMAQKSAFIDAVLRASGLSDFFTQDLEDMNKENVEPPNQKPFIKTTNTQEIGTGAQLLIKDLQECQTQEQYIKISQDITLAHDNNKLTGAEYHAIVQEAKKTIKRLAKTTESVVATDEKPWEKKWGKK